jgi:hypothetical protein
LLFDQRGCPPFTEAPMSKKSKRQSEEEVRMHMSGLYITDFVDLAQTVYYAAGLNNRGFTLEEVILIAEAMRHEVESNFKFYASELGRAASLGTALILLAFELAFAELEALWAANQHEKARALRDALESFCDGLDHTSIAHVLALLMVSSSLVFCSFVFTFLFRAQQHKRRACGKSKNRFW